MFRLPRLGCEGPRFESTETATAIVAGVDSPVSHSCAPHYQNSPNRFGNARVCVVYVGRVVALSGTRWRSVSLCEGVWWLGTCLSAGRMTPWRSESMVRWFEGLSLELCSHCYLLSSDLITIGKSEGTLLSSSCESVTEARGNSVASESVLRDTPVRSAGACRIGYAMLLRSTRA